MFANYTFPRSSVGTPREIINGTQQPPSQCRNSDAVQLESAKGRGIVKGDIIPPDWVPRAKPLVAQKSEKVDSIA